MLTFAQEVVTIHDNIDEVFAGYLNALLYFSSNKDGISYQALYDMDDFLEEDLVELFIDVSKFLAKYRNIVKSRFDIPLKYIGEDLWLSQHYMGEGFQSSTYGEHCTVLDKLAKSLPIVNIYEENDVLRIVKKKN